MLPAVIAVVVAAGAAYGVYWQVTKTERYLEDVAWGWPKPGDEADAAEKLAYLVEQAADERVQDAAGLIMGVLASPSKAENDERMRRRVAFVAALYKARPPKLDPTRLEDAVRARVRRDSPELIAWIPVPANADKIGAVMVALLREIAKSPQHWKDDREASVSVLIKELGARKLADSDDVVGAVALVALTAKSAAADNFLSGRRGHPAVLQAYIGHYRSELMRGGWRPSLDALIEGGKALGPYAAERVEAWALAAKDPGERQMALDYTRLLRGDPTPKVARILNRINPTTIGTIQDRIAGDIRRRLEKKYRPLDKRQVSAIPAIDWPQTAIASPLAYQRLNKLGTAALPALREALNGSVDGAKIFAGGQALAARLLAERDPAFLGAWVEGELKKYRTLVFAALRSGNNRTTADDPALAPRRAQGNRVAIGLTALKAAESSTLTNTPFFHALSSPVREISEFAAKSLRTRLNGDQYADAMFSHVAKKSRYPVSEIKAYVSALISYQETSDAIARNLNRLLRARAGRPEKVFWAHKIIGLLALADIGKKAAIPVLEKYGTDTGSYYDIQTTTNSVTGEKEEKKTVKTFAGLVTTSISKIMQRP